MWLNERLSDRRRARIMHTGEGCSVRCVLRVGIDVEAIHKRDVRRFFCHADDDNGMPEC